MTCHARIRVWMTWVVVVVVVVHVLGWLVCIGWIEVGVR